MGNSFPIELVSNSNFNFIQHVQNVKFCQSNAVKQVTCIGEPLNMCHCRCCVMCHSAGKNTCMLGKCTPGNITSTAATKHLILCLNSSRHSRGEAINHMSVSDNDEIQPATASLPSCGYTHLMTSRLQQLSYCLKSRGGKKITPTCYLIINKIKRGEAF